MTTNQFVSFWLIMLVITPLQAIHQPTPDLEKEQAAILQTLNYSFHGVNIGELDAIKKAYHPGAMFAYINKKGEMASLTTEDFFVTVAADNYVKYERSIKLKNIDITGNAALVEAIIDYDKNGKRLHDFISLIKVNGAWKIISRVSYKEYAAFYGQKEWILTEADFENIRKNLNHYLKGGDKCDVERLGSALDDQILLAYINEENRQLEIQNKEIYLKGYAQKEGQKLKRDHQIKYIHAKGNVAVAKVVIRFKDYKATLTDYISLIKKGDEWQVVSKISNKDKMKYISSL